MGCKDSLRTPGLISITLPHTTLRDMRVHKPEETPLKGPLPYGTVRSQEGKAHPILLALGR